jgi:hypothetical protein
VTTLSPLDEKRERPLNPKEVDTLKHFFLSSEKSLSLSPLKTSTLSREEQKKNTRTRIKEAERERERVSFVRVNLVV